MPLVFECNQQLTGIHFQTCRRMLHHELLLSRRVIITEYGLKSGNAPQIKPGTETWGPYQTLLDIKYFENFCIIC